MIAVLRQLEFLNLRRSIRARLLIRKRARSVALQCSGLALLPATASATASLPLILTLQIVRNCGEVLERSRVSSLGAVLVLDSAHWTCWLLAVLLLIR